MFKHTIRFYISYTHLTFQKAGLGICDLTITSERNAVVDFSIPFMSLGISLLFREEEPEAPDRFSFIKPLSLDVWLYLATTYVIVSFVLLICARLVFCGMIFLHFLMIYKSLSAFKLKWIPHRPLYNARVLIIEC